MTRQENGCLSPLPAASVFTCHGLLCRERGTLAQKRANVNKASVGGVLLERSPPCRLNGAG
jgi:hypothetical protein